MKPLRVTVDVRLSGYRRGGIARYGEELITALSRLERIDVIPLRSLKDPAGNGGARKLRTPPHHRFERYAVAAEILLQRTRPDVHHAIDFIAPRIPGVPVVATVHDLEFLRHPELLDDDGRRYYNQIEDARRWTTAWIAPSRWTANDFCNHFNIDPEIMFVIPHGGPDEIALIPPVSRAERQPFLLAVGTIEPRKRYGFLLDALDAMKEPPELRIVGQSGWKSDETARLLEQDRRVTWLNNIDDDALQSLYRTAWAVVVPSLSEGFGLAALEAMAAGTPVISSGHGALPEVTGDAALVPDSDDAPGWARAIERIIGDEPLWNELSLFGQRRARTFTWQRAAEATLDVYRAARCR